MINLYISILSGIYIEIAWVFSTVFGILLFLVEIAILFWVSFDDLQDVK